MNMKLKIRTDHRNEILLGATVKTLNPDNPSELGVAWDLGLL